jgi:SAM-dependent methyltransferase
MNHTPPFVVEVDCLEGLEDLLADELDQHAPGCVLSFPRPATVRVEWPTDLRRLLELRCAAAAYLLLDLPVPRPKALLGHQFFQAIAAAAQRIIAMHPAGAFRSLRLNAAGDDSSVMQRLKQELADTLGLTPATEDGDLLLRLRRSAQGWEVLLRISPRPLSVRPWRVCNFPGAPNAALAHALVLLTDPQPRDRVLNLACGSGTLLIERLLASPAREAIGCDTNPNVLQCARENLIAAGVANQARLECWDATALPLETASFDILLADLPFGQLVGSHSENEKLYPKILSEAARVAALGARMVLLTHEIRLLEQALQPQWRAWEQLDLVRVRSGGMTPGIFVLERRSP